MQCLNMNKRYVHHVLCATLGLSFSVISLLSDHHNLAWTRSAPTINEQLLEHSRGMTKTIYEITSRMYLAVGYGLANSTMVIGDDGIIIIDTMETKEAAEEVLSEFRKITDKPIKAIIYTHNHFDHIGGVCGFVTKEQVERGEVVVIGHETLLDEVTNTASVVGPILGDRSSYSLGTMLEKGPEGSINEGIGPVLQKGTMTFITPTIVLKDTLEITISGVRMQILHMPSEANDEIVIWFPAWNILQSAEVIQGESFPNVHTIRGTHYRDPVQWYQSIDRMRELGAHYMVPSHGRPVHGKVVVDDLLTAYRDAIQYVHDQTVYHMNRGLTPDELVEKVCELPEHLKHHPWLQEFYGTVVHTVRQIYFGYLGWFNGDPTDLDPTPFKERAARYIAMMGGRDVIIKTAQEAITEEAFQWAAELLTYVIRVNHTDMEARLLKAQALRELGYREMNINWRNWYITAAQELEGTISYNGTIVAPDIVRALPAARILATMPVRLDAHKALDIHMTLLLHFTDVEQEYALEIRRGIAQFHEKKPVHEPELVVRLTQSALHDMVLNKVRLDQAVRQGDAFLVHGSFKKLNEFCSCFNDGRNGKSALLTVR